MELTRINLKSAWRRIRNIEKNMNVTRLVGMALAIVGFIVAMICWGFSTPVRLLSGLYLGITLFVIGLLVYAVGSFREAHTKRRFGT